jgi:hypothetical protein
MVDPLAAIARTFGRRQAPEGGLHGRRKRGAATVRANAGSDSDAGQMASYAVNPRAVERAHRLIEARQYVLDSDWGASQPTTEDENRYLRSHSWDDYAEWHLGLTEGANDETKARYAFVFGDLRRIHRSGLIACHFRAAEWRHKDVELAAHELLQVLDRKSGLIAAAS